MEHADHVGGSTWDGHLLLLHRSESERRAGLVAWVQRGLDLGQKIIYAERPTEPADRRLLNVLSEACLDSAAAVRTKQLEVLPPAEFFDPGKVRQLIDKTLSAGYPGVRVSAEATSALTVVPRHEQINLERAVDELCRSRPVSAMCQYEAAGAAGPRLDEITGAHVGGLREHLLNSEYREGGLAFSGEIDMSNWHVAESTLRAALDTAAGEEFRLDLYGLRFIDVAGVRTVVKVTEPYRHRGGHLTLVARHQPEWVMRMLDVDQRPNVALLGGER